MKYLNITLTGFKYMSITGFDTISITPESALQLILGTNGSGKSSILKEISPLPGEKDAFKKHGSKEVIIQHNQSTYKLRTEFNQTTKCSFICLDNNEELNPGGTQSVQLSLVKQYFNYDQKVHNLLHSLESFTEMSPTRRREYFTSITSVSYQYALEVWDRLKNKLRDTQGALKILKKNLLDETAKAQQTLDIELLKDNISKLENEVRVLQNNIPNLPIEEINITPEQRNRFESEFNLFKSSYKSLRKNRNINPDDLNQQLNELNTRISVLENENLLLMKQFREIDNDLKNKKGNTQRHQDDIKNMVKLYIENATQFKNEQTNLISQLNNQQSVNHITDLLKHDADKLNRFHEVSDTLLQNITYLDNEYQVNYTPITQSEYQSLNQKLHQSKLDLEHFNKEYSINQDKQEELLQRKSQHQVECPNCEHKFIPGFSESLLNKLKDKHQHLENQIQKVKQFIQDNQYKLEQYENYHEAHDRLHRLFKTHPSFTYLSRYFEHTKDFPTIIRELKHIRLITLKTIKLKENQTQLESKQKELDEFTLVSIEDIEEADNKAKDIQHKVSLNQAGINTLKREQDTIRSTIKLQKQFEQLRIKNQTYLNELEKNAYFNAIKLLIEAIKDTIKQKQIQIAEYYRQLNQYENRHSVIQDMETRIQTLSKEEQNLKILINEISPTTGLIASGLTDFIQLFVHDMNKIIKRIWSYPLEVKLPSFEEQTVDLNYKFPMVIGNNQLKTPDVSNGSSGIKEVVNLAFKLTALRMSNMSDYPLFLDEFGATFDLQHRSQSANVIRSILEAKIHEQVFMISHYHESYGSLIHADVLVLSKDNIQHTDKVSNKHVVFSNMEVNHE